MISDDAEYVTCEDCGHIVPAANLAIHRARACGGRARAGGSSGNNDDSRDTSPMEVDDDRAETIDLLDSPPARTRELRRRRISESHRQQYSAGGDDYQESTNDMSNAFDGFASAPRRSPSPIAARDVVDLTMEPDSPQPSAADQWSCPKCTLLNPRTQPRCDACRYVNPELRAADQTRSERLIDDYDSFGPSNQNSTLLNVGGAALLGSLIGGAASYMRGRPVSDGLVEGAMTGAVGGAVADTVIRASPPRNSVTAARSGAALGQPPYPSFSPPSRSSQRPRGSVRVIRRVGDNGMVMTRVIRSGGPGTQTVIRPGHEDPIVSLMMSNLFAGGMNVQSPDNMGYESLLQAFGDGAENMGADELDIHSLPTAKIKDVEKEIPENARQCSICLEDFENGDERKTLPCLHGFHEDCINKALRHRGCCPICKHDLKSS